MNNQYVNVLTDQQKESITRYTSDFYYEDINKRLYTDIQLSSTQSKIVSDIDDAFFTAPKTTEDVIVYRGVKTSYNPNVLSGFFSTSLDYDVAMGHADDAKGCCMFVITIKKGSKVLPVWSISRHPTEKEVLINRNEVFHADKVENINGMDHYYFSIGDMEELEVSQTRELSTGQDKDMIELLSRSINNEYIELFGLDEAIDIAKDLIEKVSGRKIPKSISDEVRLRQRTDGKSIY